MGYADTLDIPDCIPARMLNEFAYCPRLAYIEWVQGDFADNYETVDGRYAHRAVDREGGSLPEPGAAPETAGDADTIHAHSVWLSADDEHLTAKIDLVEGSAAPGELLTPVDYKRSRAPETPERSYEPERVQLCAQGIVLRASGYLCERGVIYYVASKTRVPVEFDDGLIERTRTLVEEMREVAAAGRIPPPLEDSPKCWRCSLAGICLPDETRALAAWGGAENAGRAEVRRILPARDDSSPLYVQEQGARIGKSGETFAVTLKGSKLGEARIFETSQVCVFGNVQVTTQALNEAFERDVPVAFFTTGGWFHGLAHGMSHKNVELRQAQYAVAADDGMRLELARAFVSAKVDNCRTLLMRNHPDVPDRVTDELARLSADAVSCAAMDSLLGIEGLAARTYFSEFAGMLKPRDAAPVSAWSFDFAGRNRRPPRDPVNAMLSYAYSLLAKDLTVAALVVGFDPFLGFYHRPRYGRPALALDLIEEFRPIVADSVVLWAINNAVVGPGDFVRRGTAASLTSEARKRFIKAYERRLDALVTHPVFEYRVSYRRVLEIQMRLLGRVLLGEIPSYLPFRTR